MQLATLALHKRDKGEQLLNKMTYPPSPAFVHNYATVKNEKKKKDIKLKLKSTVDHLVSKNIPFCTEEDKFYKVLQNKSRFKNF